MLKMKTTVIYDGISYTHTFIDGKFRVLVSSDGKLKTNLKKIQSNKFKLFIVCVNCKNPINTLYKSRIVHTPYVCHKCSITGERNPFYGKKHSNETKELQRNIKLGKYDGEKNPMFGVSWKDIVKTKIGDNKFEEYLLNKNMSQSKRMSGDKNPFYGKTHTPEAIKKISEANKAYAVNPVVKQKQRELALTRILLNKYKMTKPEKIMKAVLLELSIPNHYNFILEKRYQYDFKIKDTNIIIEVHGDYWHCNPKIYPTGPISDRQKFKIERDTEKKKYAEKHGYTIIYVWEDELKNNIQLVKERILNEIQIKENRKD